MGTSIFLGMPPENIKNWIIEHGPEPSDVPDPVDTTEWGQVVAALENCTPGQFDSSTLAYTGSDSLLTAFNLGSGVSDLKYNIYSSDDPVDTTWINLGFNATVPEYVKYRRAIDGGWKHVWLKSLKSGLLAPIAVGDKVCLRDYNESTYDNDYYETAEVVTAVAGSFNYGNNATFSVPTSITTAKGTYDFCGYNFCLNSQPVLSVEGCISCTWSGDPDTYTGTNDWSQATLRKWLNTTGTVDGMRFYNTDTEYFTNFKGLYSRLLANDGFMKNVAKAVNRTWVKDDFVSGKTLDENQCEHIVDKFWLLGNGNVNCTGKNGSSQYLKDYAYDTFKSSLFTNDDLYHTNSSRVRYKMDYTGSTSTIPVYWALRSASTNDGFFVGCVHVDGYVDDRLYVYYPWSAVVPACLIG